jgi:hypothetical protein
MTCAVCGGASPRCGLPRQREAARAKTITESPPSACKCCPDCGYWNPDCEIHDGSETVSDICSIHCNDDVHDYLIEWRITGSFKNPRAAAEWAKKVMQEPGSRANVFHVTDDGGNETVVDL